MKNSLNQEFYKFRHQKSPFYGVIILFLLMLYTAASNIGRTIITMGFGTGQWIVIILIAIGSSFIAMEYQNNTIINLFYKNSQKQFIYLAKFIIVALYGGFLTITGTIFTFVIKALLVGNRYNWLAIYHNQHSLLNNLLVNTIGTFLMVIFIVSLSFLLIALIKINAVVVGIGLLIAYLGAQVSSAIMQSFTGTIGIMKWNPFNMMYVMGQLSDNSYFKFSNLTNLQIISGTVTYTVIFLILGYQLFKKRRV
ncbi:ABC transporter permease [Dellaglioa sp. BT-FLS60]